MKRTPQQAAHWQQIAARLARDPLPPRDGPVIGTVEIDGRYLQEGETVFIVPETDTYEFTSDSGESAP